MDANLQKELETFQKDMKNLAFGVDKKAGEMLAMKEKTCFENARLDSDKFADCMYKSSKVVTKQATLFEMKVHYLQNSLMNCFIKAEGASGEIDNCKEEAKTQMSKFLEDFYSRISK